MYIIFLWRKGAHEGKSAQAHNSSHDVPLERAAWVSVRCPTSCQPFRGAGQFASEAGLSAWEIYLDS